MSSLGIPMQMSSFDLAIALDECEDSDMPGDADDLGAPATGPDCIPSPHLNNTPPPQSHRNRKRALKRREQVIRHGHSASHRTIFEHVQLSDAVNTQYNISRMPAANGAFSSQHLRSPRIEREKAYTPAALLELGFTVLEWDGIEPRPLLDSEGRIFAVLAGRPNDPTYITDMRRFFGRALSTVEQGGLSHAEQHHRRGDFPSLPFGISYGSGQTAPKRLTTGAHSGLVSGLLRDQELSRMAGYADASFQLWAPRLYSHYQACLRAVEEATGTTRNFPGGAFACATLNYGPQVWTFQHRDSLNLPYGLCAIQSLGTFDPKLGGHLVLWDLKLVIEFPPYSTILIPSSCLTHSNTPIQSHEHRMSFTQYSAGGLFRWVSNSCMTELQLKAYDRVEYTVMMEKKPTRWLEALALFSTYQELTSCI